MFSHTKEAGIIVESILKAKHDKGFSIYPKQVVKIKCILS